MKQRRSRSKLPAKVQTRLLRTAEKYQAPFLARMIEVVAAFALFLPLVTNLTSFHPSVLKALLFRVAVQVMLFLYVVLAARIPAYRPHLNLVSYGVLAWFSVMFISSLPGVSIDAWSSWWGDFWRMGGMVSQLHLLAYFVVLSQTMKHIRQWIALLAAALFSSVLMGFSGMLQYLNLNYIYRFPQDSRIEGAAGNAAFLATAMLLGLFLASYLLCRKDRSTTFAGTAKTWLLLLALLDLFILGWDSFTHGEITSGLANPPVAVFALVLHALILFWFFLRDSVRAGLVFMSLFGAWCLFWMYQTQTRGALFGLGGAVFFLFVVYLLTGANLTIRLICAGAMVLVLLVPIAVVINRRSSFVQSHPTLIRYSTLSLNDPSAENRLMAWKASGQAILDRPLLGWGPENFRYAFERHFPSVIYRSLTEPTWVDRAHNFVMDIGVTTGLSGLASYLALYGLILVLLIRHWLRTKDVANGLMLSALFLAYLFQCLFTFDTINSDVTRFLILAFVAYFCSKATNPESRENGQGMHGPRLTVPGWIAIGAAAALLPAAWYCTVSRPLTLNRLTEEGRRATHVLDPQTRTPRIVFNDAIVRLFAEADGYYTTGWHDMHEVFVNYAFEVAHTPYIPLGQKVTAIQMGVDYLEESIRRQPANSRYYLLLASFVNGTTDVTVQSDPGLARALAEKVTDRLLQAAILSPTRPQVYFERSNALLFLGRDNERIDEFAKGVAVCPVIKDPHVDLMTLYIASGRDQDAAKEWQNIKSMGFPLARADYDRVINAYESKKKFAEVAELYKEMLAQAPNDANLMAQLASSYSQMGEVELARQTALKAVALSPQLAGALRPIIDAPRSPSKKDD